MRLKEVGIKNFRGYRNETRIKIDANVTGITGRNDVGKSSILEALDIFFDGGEVAIDKDDFNVAEPEGSVEIRCVFDNLPAEILLDETNRTTLAGERLLNSANELEILKRYKRSSKDPAIFIVANHPSAASFDDLHTLKITDLKKRGEEAGVVAGDVADARKSALWRAAIADQFNIPWALFLDSDLGTPEHGPNLAEVQALRLSGKKAYVTRKREPENYILLEVLAPHITGAVAVVLTDTCDAKREIAIATSKGLGEVLEFFWTQMNAEQIRRAEKYADGGTDRYEFTEILTDFLTLA